MSGWRRGSYRTIKTTFNEPRASSYFIFVFLCRLFWLNFFRTCRAWTETPVKWSWWTVSGRRSACSPSTAWLWRNGTGTRRTGRSTTSPTSSRVRETGRGVQGASFSTCFLISLLLFLQSFPFLSLLSVSLPSCSRRLVILLNQTAFVFLVFSDCKYWTCLMLCDVTISKSHNKIIPR